MTDARHTHYSPYGPPRQVPGTLLECTDSTAHDARDSTLWADYGYNPRLEPSWNTGLSEEVGKAVTAAYLNHKTTDLSFAITEVVADPDFTYRVTFTNRTRVALGDSGPVWHTEEWGLYPDGAWHGISRGLAHHHTAPFCPGCGY